MFRKIAGKIKSGGVLVFTTELITSFTELRRLDFYTREELENITAVLEKEGVRLMDPLDWSAMHECEIATRGTPGAFHTAICLAFKKK